MMTQKQMQAYAQPSMRYALQVWNEYMKAEAVQHGHKVKVSWVGADPEVVSLSTFYKIVDGYLGDWWRPCRPCAGLGDSCPNKGKVTGNAIPLSRQCRGCLDSIPW